MAGFREGNGLGGEGGSRGDRVWGVIKLRVCWGLRSYWGSEEVVGARGVTGRREAHGGWSDMVEEVTRFRG